MYVIKELLELPNRQTWRSWLLSNYAASPGVWVANYKVKYAAGRLTSEEAVQEALCFGWIDSTTRKLDEERFAQRFSPRKPGIVWALSNIHRVDTLVAEGRMTDSGLLCVQQAKESGTWQAGIDRELNMKLPEELETEFIKLPELRQAFEALPASRKKQIVYWLTSAKKPETGQKSIQATLAELTNIGD